MPRVPFLAGSRLVLRLGCAALAGACGSADPGDAVGPGTESGDFRRGTWIAEAGDARIQLLLTATHQGGFLTGRWELGGSGRINHPDPAREILDLALAGESYAVDMILRFHDRRRPPGLDPGLPHEPRLLATFTASRISDTVLVGVLSTQGYDPSLGPTPFEGPGGVTFRRR